MEFFRRRHLMSPLLLVFVLFTFFDSILSKHHIRHHRDRFKRQQGAHLYLPGTSVTSGGEGPDAGPWSDWSEASPCSRTCGGGVSTQQRQCQPRYTCQGPTKRHFSCNTQDCPDISDYRSQQCSEYDNIPFEGIYYQWIPYTKAPNPCELNCMPRGERFYYRHKQHVVDGTPCNDEKLDVCVEGTCQPVGCDMMLGSDAKEDRCRQCGGDGAMCNTVTGLLDMQDLQVGYNDILLIPAGATNIDVREIAPSNNYLAARNTTGHYYLNGNWRIDFPRSLDFAGCKFHYDRYPKGFAAPDSVTCLGPTDEALFIVLLYQDVNVGVQYEYSIPKNVQQGGKTETYAWTFDEFTPCSTTCGGGIQYRNVTCAGRRTLEPADRTLCDNNNEPPSSQRCGDQPCEPRWMAKPWERCSAPCGDNGTQTRQVYCEQIIANGVASIVDDQHCVNVQKPPTEQPCNQGLVCANWHVDPWKPCDHLCGDGKKNRKVICYRKTNGTIEALDDSECASQEEKPTTEEKCNLRPCEGVDWVTSEWSGCEDKCGLASETRRVECATLKGEIFSKELCEDIPIPELVRQCNTTDAACDVEWYTSQWSECSAKCGSGVQTRKVFCGSMKDEGIKRVEDVKCDPDKKYNSMKNCTADKKECTGEWFAGPWSKCSKACGGTAERTRKVICLRDNVAVSATDCDPNTIAFSSEACNTEACSEDQILTSASPEGTSVTKSVDEAESPTPTSSTDDNKKGGDDEYEEVFAETCEDGEWVDDQEDKEESGGTPSVGKFQVTVANKKSDEEEEATETSIFDDELMLGDDTTVYVNQDTHSTDIGSGDGGLSSETPLSSYSSYGSSLSTVSGSTVEGSGDYSTSDLSATTVSGITESSDTTKDVSKITGSSDSSDLTTKSSSSDSSGLTSASDSSANTSPSDSSDLTSVSSITDSSGLTSESSVTDSSGSTLGSGSSSDSSSLTSDSASSDSFGLTSESGPTMPSVLTSESASSDSSGLTSKSGSTESSALSSEFSSSDSSGLTSKSSSTESSALSSEFSSSDSSGFTSKSGSTESSALSSELSSSDSSGLTSESDSTDSSDRTSEPSATDLTPTSDTTPPSESTVSSDFSSTSESLSTDIAGLSSLSSGSSVSEDASAVTSLSTTKATSISIPVVGGESEDGAKPDEESSVETTLIGESSTEPSTDFSGSTVSGASSDGSTDISGSTVSGASTTESTDISGSTVSGASTKESTDISGSTVSGASTEESTGMSGSTVSGASTEVSTDISGSTVSGASTEESTGISGSSVSGASTEESTDISGSTVSGVSTEESTGISGSSLSGVSTEESTSGSSVSDISTEEYTGSTGSSVSGEMSSSTEFTGSTETTTEYTGSTESTTKYTGSTEFDIWSSSQESGLTTESTSSDLWGTTSITEIFAIKKMKKCRKRKECKKTKYGCCIDKITPAKGPFDKGCPITTTCKETPFGCCEDGVSVAMGKDFEGCPLSHCNETLFGCCPDNKTEAEGSNNEGCPPPPPECLKTKYGCCKDNVTEAKGPDEEGCEQPTSTTVEPTSTTVEPTTETSEHCSNSTYGCCPDGESSALGKDYEGCDIFKDNCTESYFGCCLDGTTSAKGLNYKGCKMPCEENQYGCCEDGVTPAHGPNREGCCLATQHGCCPDNIRPAHGPNLEGCGCQYSPYRCCPDNITAAQGYYNEGCGCQYTQHGCCPDSYTPAAGPDFHGCQCNTFQFGCCPDGATIAQGQQNQGCGCKNTEYGCCADEATPAQGPNRAGCGCESTTYGCCVDGHTEAQGENFEGCEEVPANLQVSCTLEKERGSCRNYTVKWFFDTEYGGCSRFWYGGCDGNSNRFKSKEECVDVCVEPQGRDRCSLPKVSGGCEGYYPQWYYDNERKACSQFIYGGCLGNNNRFETIEECTDLCVKDNNIDACEQSKDEGPCHGNFPRWYFDKTSGICTQFIYGGCKSNNNNFLTESACKQKCAQPGRKKDHCSVPRAQGNCTGRDPRWYYNASEKSCMPFYYSGCGGNNNNFASQEACEADCPKEIVKDTCQLPAEVGECGNYVTHWYYDTRDKRCRQFYYGGCGGNANNFQTEQACQQRCEVPATAAPPVVEQPQTPEPQPPQPQPPQPQPQPPIPGKEEPFKAEFCFLDSDVGPCRAYIAKWYYDKSDGACKQFMYGGCPGNGNNFDNADECQEKCGPVQDLCSLPVVVGPCKGEFEQWYYNRGTDSCQSFTYGGCLGNKNRFDNRVTCEQQCKQHPILPTVLVTQAPLPEPTSRPTDLSVCYISPDPGNCTDSYPSYYYDISSQKCSAFVYTGCGGNANRYNSIEQCERQCGQFRGQDVCRLQRDPGPCRESLVKYYYDAVYGRCAPFYYGGCDGNGNRFSSLEECEYVCVTHEEKKPPEIPQGGASAICRLPLDVGPCEGGYHKYYYFDDSRGECVPFIYSGCGGNFNNFKSFQACLDFCKEFMLPTEELPGVAETESPEKGEHPCQKYIDECGTMRCEYSTEAYVDEETLCTKCRCHNPCRNTICDEGFQCAVDLNRNRTTYDDPTFIAVCRPINKEGECPQISSNENRCERECENDADCSMDLKCCSTGCGTSCVVPVSPIPAQHLSTPYLPAYTEAPVQVGHFPPKVDETKFKPEVSAGEGDYATLDCAVQGNPTPTITWKKGNLLIDGTKARYRLLLDGALQIITLHRTDSGIYLCAADNGIGQPIEKAIKLDVTDSMPHSTYIVGDDANSHVVAALGAPTTLQCYATGYPFPQITWWKDDNMIAMGNNQFEVRKDYSLLIHSVQLSNLGIYTCQAYNGIGKAASWSVTVQALGPVHSTRPEDRIYMQYVVNPPESPTRSPYRPEYPYQPEPRPDPRPEIPPYVEPEVDPNEILPEPPAEGKWVYQVPVRANITQTQNRFRTGSDISLGCDVDGNPIPQVQWYKDGQPLYPSESIQISESHRLHINNAKQSDSGEYRCEAANNYSRSASSINIVVEGLYIHPNCTDNQFFANCALIVRAQFCQHKYYARFCCKSCTEAGQLQSDGPHLGIADDKHSALSSNLVRRK